MRSPIASELVGDQPSRFAPLSLQQLPEESLGSAGVSSTLDQDIDHVAVLINGAPQVVSLALDADEDLVQEPDVSESTLPPVKPPSVVQAELPTPESDRLVRDGDTSLRQEILDVAEAQAEAVIEPHGVADDLDWETVSAIAALGVGHGRTLPASPLS